jgi:photosystem II stability/assembly factor-like uncharacterized protein
MLRVGPADAQARSELAGQTLPSSLLPPATPCPIFKVSAVGSDAAWAITSQCLPGADKSTLLRTTDGGRHWAAFDLGELSPAGVQAADPATAWLTDQFGRLFTTTDGGADWDQVR